MITNSFLVKRDIRKRGIKDTSRTGNRHQMVLFLHE
jgi:hypothetical protein